MRIFTTLGLAVLLFAGCGKFDRLENGGFTTVSFQGDRNPAIANLTGGVMVFAYSSSFATNLKLSSGITGTTASITLPNGLYSFYAIGYDGDPNTFSTNLKCAVEGAATPVPLDGSAKTISLTFNAANCQNGSFSPAALFESSSGNTNFSRFQVTFCGSDVGSALASSTLTTSHDCSSGGSLGTAAPWSGAQGFQIVAPIFKSGGTSGFVKLADGFRSSCITGSVPVGFNNSGNLRFPAGVSGQPGRFPLEFETFSETACTSPPIAVHKFHHGVTFGPVPTSTEHARVLNSSQFPKLFLRQP